MISDFLIAIIIAGIFTPIAIWQGGKEWKYSKQIKFLRKLRNVGKE